MTNFTRASRQGQVLSLSSSPRISPPDLDAATQLQSLELFTQTDALADTLADTPEVLAAGLRNTSYIAGVAANAGALQGYGLIVVPMSMGPP